MPTRRRKRTPVHNASDCRCSPCNRRHRARFRRLCAGAGKPRRQVDAQSRIESVAARSWIRRRFQRTTDRRPGRDRAGRPAPRAIAHDAPGERRRSPARADVDRRSPRAAGECHGHSDRDRRQLLRRSRALQNVSSQRQGRGHRPGWRAYRGNRTVGRRPVRRAVRSRAGASAAICLLAAHRIGSPVG